MSAKYQPLGSVSAAHEVHDLRQKAAVKPNLAMAASWVFAGVLTIIVLFMAFMDG
jgi:hypothetical protein